MYVESVILLAKLQSFGTPIISIVLQIPAQTTKKSRNKKINDENSNEAIVALEKRLTCEQLLVQQKFDYAACSKWLYH